MASVTKIFIQMASSTIGGIIGVAVFIIGYILYGMFKSGRQMARLQEMAELFNDEFRSYIEQKECWKVSDNPNTKWQWYKLIPSVGNPYYISYDGPISFQTAVEYLMKGFVAKINNENNSL